MKIAWCLYGQPRLYDQGYINIKNFIDKHPNVDFDFFFHCWFNESEVGNYYSVAWYRNLSKEETLIKPNTDTELIKLYNPKSYIFEESKIFDVSFIQNSLIDIYTPSRDKTNYNNYLSNLYSKYRVNYLLQNYINDHNLSYDLVISTRFDYLNEIIVDIENINTEKINIAGYDKSRIILNDSIIITNTKLFNIYSQTYNNLCNIINNTELLTDNNSQPFLSLVPECILGLNLIYNKINITDIIEQREDIHNFLKS